MNIEKNNMFSGELARMRCANVKQNFLVALYSGKNLDDACGLVKVNPAVLGFVRSEDVDFDKAVRQAQGFRIEVMVDKLENIHLVADDAAMAAVVSRNIQWLASKRLREIYGDKMDVNHNVTINIKGAMEEARKRIMHDVSPNMLIDNTNATDSTSVAQAPLIIDAEEIDPLS